MAKPIVQVEQSILIDGEHRILVGSNEWSAWLQEKRTFRVLVEDHAFSVVWHRAASRWMAYREVGGKRAVCYLESQLTLERLLDANALLWYRLNTAFSDDEIYHLIQTTLAPIKPLLRQRGAPRWLKLD